MFNQKKQENMKKNYKIQNLKYFNKLIKKKHYKFIFKTK